MKAPPWKKGQSGNPAGLKKGTRHRATMMAERLLCGDIEDVIRAVINAAKAGDMAAAKLILERVCPVPRGAEICADRLARLERILGIEAQEYGRLPQVIEGENEYGTSTAQTN